MRAPRAFIGPWASAVSRANGGSSRFADFRRSSGEKAFLILHQIDDRNTLTLLFDWDTPENAKSFLASSELKSAMQKAGVAEEPKIEFLNEAAKGSV